jgi:hypothetical protein
MATGKRFYWIKLRNSFFHDSDFAEAVDFLMSQKNGANYIILYQMLCLMTANTGGKMANAVGEVIVPYDPAKIARECKWFTVDTVVVALELYKKLGWVYQQEDGVLRIVDLDRMVGSETDYAVQKQNQRLGKGVDNVHTDVHTDVSEMSTAMSTQEIRDKSLDIKNTDIRDKSLKNTVIQQRLVKGAGAREEKGDPPTLLEVSQYMKTEFDMINTAAEAEKFIAWNAVRGWVCLPNWQAAADLWCARIGERG